jgi:hypothetical protein
MNKELLIDQYIRGCSMLIFSFDAFQLSIQDTILRNYLAKSISQLQTITTLNITNQTFDCYIIYRSMVDRLGHLYFLERTDSFNDFDDWSFMKQFESTNKALSDPLFKDRLNPQFFKLSENNKVRYKKIKERKTTWKRPDIESEFKNKDLQFLYRFGYDYASSHVHPMANDGLVEYNAMILNPSKEIMDYANHHRQLITQNSTLISSLMVNECLNMSSLKWRALVFKFIESFRLAINNQENEFLSNFKKMEKYMMDNLPLGQKEK